MDPAKHWLSTDRTTEKASLKYTGGPKTISPPPLCGVEADDTAFLEDDQIDGKKVHDPKSARKFPVPLPR